LIDPLYLFSLGALCSKALHAKTCANMLKSYQAELDLNAGMASVLHDVKDRKQKVKVKRFV